ncbi:hypothetical protein AGDE_08774 [Angomonas deanei]|uniref:Amastin surface glycoprotein, putative n=1 Tax=Angomonas deanei TaxID=59799 RepID=A0A7G2CGM0_9TRYP|nr:hypothetical protein AGDE_08774 [Angomonas deanei]CAD2218896.1 Amastin surface glycoprotein, putative [Angomonas deanei]|eukprot:EPY32275.1 hypothetical protein AGDE_08774 [Angomonas deanei]
MDGTVQRALVGARSTFGGPDVQRVGIHFMVVFSFFHFLFVLLACVLSQIDVNGGGCFTYWGYKEECDNTSYTTRPDLFADKTAKNNFRAAAAFSIFSILLGVLLIGASWLLCCRLRRAIRIAKRKAVNHAQAKSKGGKSHYSRLDDIPNEDVAELTAKEEGEGEGGAHVQPVFAVGLIKWITVAIMSGGCLCGLICWAIMAGTYSSRAHSVQILLGKGAVVAGEKRDTSYGVGFGLQLTSWLLELIMVVLFSILI